MNSVLVVTTPATTQDLTTLAAVKTELSITDKASDDKLAAAITQASAVCADYCGRTFGLETLTETFRFNWPARSYLAWDAGPGDRAERYSDLLLERRPIVSVASVVEAGVTLDPATDYAIQADAGTLTRLRSDMPASWLAQTIVVTYTGGYTLPGGCPSAINRACIEMVKRLWFASDRDPALRQINIPGVVERAYAVGAATDVALPAIVTQLLAPHRDYRF